MQEANAILGKQMQEKRSINLPREKELLSIAWKFPSHRRT